MKEKNEFLPSFLYSSEYPMYLLSGAIQDIFRIVELTLTICGLGLVGAVVRQNFYSDVSILNNTQQNIYSICEHLLKKSVDFVSLLRWMHFQSAESGIVVMELAIYIQIPAKAVYIQPWKRHESNSPFAWSHCQIPWKMFLSLVCCNSWQRKRA